MNYQHITNYLIFKNIYSEGNNNMWIYHDNIEMNEE